MVVGAANNQLASVEDAERLRSRGILYAPDYVVNAGAAMAIPWMETLGWSQADAEKQVVESIKGALRKVIELSVAEGITTEAAARRIAEERLS